MVGGGTLALGDDNVVSSTIDLDQPDATLVIDPGVAATDTIDGAISGTGSVVIGTPSMANGGLVVLGGAVDNSGGMTIYADETVEVISGGTLGTGTVTITGDRTQISDLPFDANVVLDGGSLANEIVVATPAAVIYVAADSVDAGAATLAVASGSTLAVVGEGATLDVSAAATGLGITGGSIVTIEGITLASTDGTALTIGSRQHGDAVKRHDRGCNDDLGLRRPGHQCRRQRRGLR